MSIVRYALLAAAALAPNARADDVPAALRDPWVPPSVRQHAQTAPLAAQADIRTQVEAKLRANFDAADTEHRGSITREQALAAHLGHVANNFDAIDTAHQGRVTFDDYKRFLRARGARTL